MIKMATAGASALLILAGTAGVAQAAGAASPLELCKGGQLMSLRLNTIKPGQTAAYEKAARDHMAWYRGHGYSGNRMLVGPVITGNRAEGWTASNSEYASVHMDAPGVPPDKRDAGWDAYVKEYRDASDLSVDKFACVREVK